MIENRFHECSICLTPIDDDSRTLPCTHTFHKACIDEWYETSKIEIYDHESSQIEWQCPLCRHTIIEECDSVVFEFSIIKFKQKRWYIKTFTALDCMLSLISFFSTQGNLFYILWFVCSFYGFTGAHNLNIHHLQLYSWFCFFPFVYKLSHLYLSLNNINQIEIYPPNAVCILTVSSFLSLLFQVYLMYCIYFLSIQLSLYKERLRLMFNDE